MALQLFIYPQNNPDGVYSVIPGTPSSSVTTTTTTQTAGGTEYVTDPKFTTTGASGMNSYATGGWVPSIESMAVTSQLPNSNWQAFYSNDTPCVFCSGLNPTNQRDETQPPTFGTYNSGSNYRLELNGPTLGMGFGSFRTGVYQKISGLVSGARYILRITFKPGWTAPSHADFIIGSNIVGSGAGNAIANNGSSIHTIPSQGVYNHASFSTNNNNGFHFGYNITGTIEQEFEALHTEEVLVLQWHNSAGDTGFIDEVSILEKGSSSPVYTTNTTTVTTPGTRASDPDDGQVMLDLMDDKNIPISLSIDNFKNVGEKPQSYSKAFNLPGTKHNNRIFNSLYDVTVSSGETKFGHFSLHRQTRAILKDNGFPIFEGHLKLISIKEKDGVPSYNVNLFSDSVSLKQALSKKTFAHFDGGALGGGLGLSELGHVYNRTNIIASWGGGLPITALPAGYTGAAGVAGATTTNVLKYPFCQWNTNFYPSTGTGTLPAFGSPVLTTLGDAFRPWIKLKYLWDRIFSEAGFSYSSDFINNAAGFNTDFTRIFMDFNWGKELSMQPSSSTVYASMVGNPSNVFADNVYSNIKMNSGFPAFTTSSGFLATPTTGIVSIGYNTSTNKFTATQTTTTYQFSADIYFDITANGSNTNGCFDTRVVHKDSGGNVLGQDTFNLCGSVGTAELWSYTGTWVLNATETIEFQCMNLTSTTSGYNGGTEQIGTGSGSSIGFNVPHIQAICDIDPQLSNGSLMQKRGTIKQWDFIKDILTMFNLVVMQDRDNPNNLIIEPYETVFIDESPSQYITIETLDWTEKVDIDSMDISPMKLKETVKFDYKKPKDYANKMYTDETGLQFGSFEIDASNFDMAKGEQKIQLKVFSPTFNTPVFDDWSVVLTVPHITGGEIDTGADGPLENNPRVLYDGTYHSSPQIPAGTGITLDPNEYHIPAHAGVAAANVSRFGLFSHLSEHPSDSTTLDLNFGTHQLVGYGGTAPVDNLFTMYWQSYFDELYHPDTRVVKLNINLSAEDISTFNFNSKIRIKNRLYRANKIDYKPEALSKVELILLP